MSITIEIDEEIWRAAEQATDIHDPAELVRKLMEREIQLRSAQLRLAAAGGSMPEFEVLSSHQLLPNTPEQIDADFAALEALCAAGDPADDEIVERTLAAADRQSKEIVRRQMGLD